MSITPNYLEEIRQVCHGPTAAELLGTLDKQSAELQRYRATLQAIAALSPEHRWRASYMAAQALKGQENPPKSPALPLQTTRPTLSTPQTLPRP